MGAERESQVDYWLTDDGLLLLEAWSRDGNSLDEIAKKVGITRFALSKWRKRYPEIEKALSIGKELVDYKVENAVLKAALGYTTKEIKVTLGKTIKGGQVYEVLKETTTKEVAPNITAAMFWLNNRKYDDWKKNKDKVVDLGDDDSNVTINIIRGPKSDDLGDNVNQQVQFTPKKPEEVKDEKSNEEDLDYWPDDWEDEDD